MVDATGLPDRIATARLVLRCWTPPDAPRLREAIDASLEQLRPWVPWAVDEPADLATTEERLARFADEFADGTDFHFGIFESGRPDVVGGIGLHPRIGPRALELGYWVRSSRVGRGFATEAARALTEAALALPGVDRLEIRCDPENLASAAVPRKLGWGMRERLVGDAKSPDGAPRDTLVFELSV